LVVLLLTFVTANASYCLSGADPIQSPMPVERALASAVGVARRYIRFDHPVRVIAKHTGSNVYSIRFLEPLNERPPTVQALKARLICVVQVTPERTYVRWSRRIRTSVALTYKHSLTRLTDGPATINLTAGVINALRYHFQRSYKSAEKIVRFDVEVGPTVDFDMPPLPDDPRHMVVIEMLPWKTGSTWGYHLSPQMKVHSVVHPVP
jgi:hypothetical protein